MHMIGVCGAVALALHTPLDLMVLRCRRGLLLVRGLFGFGAICSYFWAVQYLPLNDAMVITYTSPIWVAVLGPFLIIKETPSKCGSQCPACPYAFDFCLLLNGCLTTSCPARCTWSALLGAFCSNAVQWRRRKQDSCWAVHSP